MLKRSLVVGGALLALLPASALAGRKYNMAGCGLGSVIMGKSGGPILAASTNGSTYNNQLFGITSGTSNCTPDSQDQASVDQENFMMTNYGTLSKEIAQGSGSTLAGLGELLGCSQGDLNAFNSLAQKNHRKIFASPGAVAALDTLKETIQTDATLAHNCKYSALNNTDEVAQ